MDEICCGHCGRQFATPEDPLGLQTRTYTLAVWNPGSQMTNIIGVYCSMEHMQADQEELPT